jgi:hypothetical protein
VPQAASLGSALFQQFFLGRSSDGNNPLSGSLEVSLRLPGALWTGKGIIHPPQMNAP